MKKIYLILAVLLGAIFLSSCTKCINYNNSLKMKDAYPTYDVTVNIVLNKYASLTSLSLLVNKYISLPEEEKDAFEDKYFSMCKIRYEDGVCVLFYDKMYYSFETNNSNLTDKGALWSVTDYTVRESVNPLKFDIVSEGKGTYGIKVDNYNIHFADLKLICLENADFKITTSQVNDGKGEDVDVLSISGSGFFFEEVSKIEDLSSSTIEIQKVAVDFDITSPFVGFINENNFVVFYKGAMTMDVKSVMGYEDFHEVVKASLDGFLNSIRLTLEFKGEKATYKIFDETSL